ncbi:MAG: tail fiber protein [Aquabacterium sp.]|nr:tail fiber protein [Aquabacterium sp.]
MSQPFVGEVRLFAGNFAPAGWSFCDGSLYAISEAEALFALIGTTYGGDGQSTFAMPDLRGRVPVHQGTGNGLSTRTMGEPGGTETVALTTQQMPAHTHALRASSAAATGSAPGGAVLADTGAVNSYGSGTPSQAMAAGALAAQGGNQPHENMAPFLTVSYIISLFGIFPQQN